VTCALATAWQRPRRRWAPLLLLLGLALEWPAASAVLARAPLVALAWHLAATGVQLVAVLAALPPAWRGGRLLGASLCLIMILLLPALGGVGLYVTLGWLPWRAPRRIDRYTDFIAPPELPEGLADRVRFSPYGSGGALGILERSTRADQRIRVVLATRKMDDRDAVPILRVALRDPVDEVRLLAYALIERKEKRISGAIREQLDRLEHEEGQGITAIRQRLAELYWELAYLGLATGEVERHILREARRHAREALAGGAANAAELHFLLARIALRREEVVEAGDELAAAERAGLPRNKLLPYRAELAFAARRLDEVPRILGELESDICHPGVLSELEAQWQ